MKPKNDSGGRAPRHGEGGPDMDLISQITRIAQVKIPVTDLAASVEWYRRLLGLRLWVEIVEDGVVRGAGLMDPHDRFNLSLRHRSVCASEPDLRGFDVVAFTPQSRAALHRLAEHCDRLRIAHSGVQETPGGALLDVPDPDGTVLRFYDFTQPTGGFTGVEFRDGRHVGFYDTSRLPASRAADGA